MQGGESEWNRGKQQFLRMSLLLFEESLFIIMRRKKGRRREMINKEGMNATITITVQQL